MVAANSFRLDAAMVSMTRVPCWQLLHKFAAAAGVHFILGWLRPLPAGQWRCCLLCLIVHALLWLLCILRWQLIHPSGLAQNFGLANLHPDDWFKPFDTGLTSNHV